MGLRDRARRLLAASGGVIVISAVLVGPPVSPAHAEAEKDWYYRNLTAELGAPEVYGEEIVSFTYHSFGQDLVGQHWYRAL